MFCITEIILQFDPRKKKMNVELDLEDFGHQKSNTLRIVARTHTLVPDSPPSSIESKSNRFDMKSIVSIYNMQIIY